MDKLQEQLNDIYEVAELELDFLLKDLESIFQVIEIKHELIELYYIRKVSKQKLVNITIQSFKNNYQSMLPYLQFIKNLK